MESSGIVLSVNISENTGTVKEPVDECAIDLHGLVGDSHARNWHRQVSILSGESIDRFSRVFGRSIAPGEFAENLTVSGIDLRGVTPGDTISVDDAVLEVTQIGKACHGDGCEIFRQVGKCVMPKEGIFCKVSRAGQVKPGSSVILSSSASRKEPNTPA